MINNKKMNSRKVWPFCSLSTRLVKFNRLSDIRFLMYYIMAYINCIVVDVMKSIKKFIPISLFLFVFFSALAVQVGFDLLDLSALPSSEKKKRVKDYENLYQSETFQTFKNKKISLNDQKNKVVIINFWASWCTPCLEELPSMVKLRKLFKEDKLKILAVNADGDEPKKKIQQISKKFNINFDIIPDYDSKILNKFNITALPVTIIYHNGKVIEIVDGPKDFVSEEFKTKVVDLTK